MTLREIFTAYTQKALLKGIHKDLVGVLNRRNLKIQEWEISFTLEKDGMICVLVNKEWWIPVELIPELKKTIRGCVCKDFLTFFTSDELSMPESLLFLKLYPARKPKKCSYEAV